MRPRLGERKEIAGIRFPKLEQGTFSLVPIFNSGDGTFHNGQDRSLIDDFEIYSGPLSADRILQRYMADIGGEISPPVVIVPRAATAVTVVGRLDEGAWATASRVPLPINAATMYPHSQWASASICYDNDNLYIGLRLDKNPGPLVTAARECDGSVGEDDAFELFLTPTPQTPQDFIQFVFNSAAAVYDARHGQSGWGGKLAVKTAVADDHWTVEAAIPFADLGTGTPKAGEMWLGNFCRDWARARRDVVRGSPDPAPGATVRSQESGRPAVGGFGEVGRPAPSTGPLRPARGPGEPLAGWYNSRFAQAVSRRATRLVRVDRQSGRPLAGASRPFGPESAPIVHQKRPARPCSRTQSAGCARAAFP